MWAVLKHFSLNLKFETKFSKLWTKIADLPPLGAFNNYVDRIWPIFAPPTPSTNRLSQNKALCINLLYLLTQYPRTNPWNFREKNLWIGGVENLSFFDLYILNFLFHLISEYMNFQKVSVYSWGLRIWISSTNFQKGNIGCPQQARTEKVLKFNMIFHN